MSIKIHTYLAEAEFYACWECTSCGTKNVSKAKFHSVSSDGYYKLLQMSLSAPLTQSKEKEKIYKKVFSSSTIENKFCNRCGKAAGYKEMYFALNEQDAARHGYDVNQRVRYKATGKDAKSHEQKLQYCYDYYKKFKPNVDKRYFKSLKSAYDNLIQQFMTLYAIESDELTQNDYRSIVSLLVDSYETWHIEGFEVNDNTTTQIYEKYKDIILSIEEANLFQLAVLNHLFDRITCADFTIYNPYKDDAPPAAKQVTAAKDAPAVSSSNEDSLAYIKELEALKTLYDKGILTEEEFKAKKSQILGLD